MTKTDLQTHEFDPYYWRYIDLLQSNLGLIEGFERGQIEVSRFFESIPEEKHSFAYAADKWTIKEVFQHLIDTERIFIYRCFRIARRDTTSLAGFDQNVYVSPSYAKSKPMSALLEEYTAGRNNSITILKSLSKEDLEFVGDANGGAMSARAAAFTIIGHDIWHMNIITERYL